MNSADYEALGRFVEQVDQIDGSTTVYKAIAFFNAAYNGCRKDSFVAQSGRFIPASLSSTFDPGKKIQSIKELRVHRMENNLPGGGLKECKEDLDEYYTVMGWSNAY